jgi:hypothetical protein
MRVTSRLVLIACTAICSLALFSGAAAANRRLGMRPSGEIRKTVQDFRISDPRGLITVTCQLTLTGSLANEIAKNSQGRLPEGFMGQITRATVEECRGTEGPVAARINAPISLRYDAFLGTLPNITGILFSKLGFNVEAYGCTWVGNPGLLMTFPPSENGFGTRFNAERFLPTPLGLSRGGFWCPSEVTLSGTGRVTPAQTLTLA